MIMAAVAAGTLFSPMKKRPYCINVCAKAKRSINFQFWLIVLRISTFLCNIRGSNNKPANEKRIPDNNIGGIKVNPILAPANAEPHKIQANIANSLTVS